MGFLGTALCAMGECGSVSSKKMRDEPGTVVGNGGPSLPNAHAGRFAVDDPAADDRVIAVKRGQGGQGLEDISLPAVAPRGPAGGSTLLDQNVVTPPGSKAACGRIPSCPPRSQSGIPEGSGGRD